MDLGGTALAVRPDDLIAPCLLDEDEQNLN
jgi:hypothetical protein